MYDANALLGVDDLRADGRRALECREIRVSLGSSSFDSDQNNDDDDDRLPMAMSNADGSCEWRQGLTSVLAAVYGPHEPLSSSGGSSTDASSSRMSIVCEVHQAPSSSSMPITAMGSLRPDRRLQELSIRLKDSLQSIIITSDYAKSGTSTCTVMMCDSLDVCVLP